MTKQEWLKVRDLEEMPMEAWFEYYLAKGGFITDFTEFQMYFAQNLIVPLILVKDGKQMQLSFATATARIHDYYNTMFNL